MSYTVLARKYRPQTFEELVGQEHVAKTLSNAIESERVAHAFLFTGVRGVGKTTTARLLAKALCCEKGPTPTPCNTCSSCEDITAGVDMDVQEVDGASNNSVDDVRRLQETLPYRPSRNRYKIVIVDEVHMLSTGAFNALLKTLEEPPSHVKFIFATTESHKVPVTIRSRCQRYDFRLIPHAVISERIRTILTREAVEADEDTIAIVSSEAAGSMRDALTLLDQLVAFSGDSLVGETVAQTLGIATRHHVLAAAQALLSGDAAACLNAVNGLADQGVDMLHFARQLLGLSRDLVVLKVGEGASDLVNLVDAEKEAALAMIADLDILEVQRAFQALSRVVDQVGRAPNQRTVLEMGLVRIATRPPLMGLASVIERLEALEGRLGQTTQATPSSGGSSSAGGGPAPTGGNSGPGGSSGGGPANGGPRRRSAASARGNRVNESGPRTRRPDGARSWALRGQEEPAPMSPEDKAAADAPLEPDSRPSLPPLAAYEEDAPVEPTATAASTTPASAKPEAKKRPEPSRVHAQKESPEPEPAANLELAVFSDSPSDRMQRWEQFLDALGESEPALSAILEHGEPREFSSEHLLFAFPEGSFYAQQTNTNESRAALTRALERHLSIRPLISIVGDAKSDTSSGTVAALKEERLDQRREEQRKQALNHPLVVEALQLFPGGANHLEVTVKID